MNSRAMKISGVTAAIILVALAALPYVINVDSLRPKLESALESSLGREVHIGYLQLSVLAGGARADDISIAEDPAFNRGNFLQAKSLNVGLSLASLIFSRSLHVTSLTVNEPHVVLAKSSTGRWNFSSFGSSQSAGTLTEEIQAPVLSSFVLDRLKISNATVELPDSTKSSPATTLKNIDIDLRNVKLDGVMAFVISTHASSGKLELRGEAGPLNRENPEQTPFHMELKGGHADLAQLAGMNSASGLSGLLNLNATVTSDGSTVHSEGTARAEKLRLVASGKPASQPVSVRYATDYSFAQQSGVLENCEISSGKAVAHLAGTYDTKGKSIATHLRLSGSQLPLDSLQGVLPALGIQLPAGSMLRGGAVTANILLEGSMDRLVTTGSAEVSNARLSGFDLGSKLSSIPGMNSVHSASELSIVSLSSKFRVAPSGTHITGLNTQLSGIGSVTGDGDIDAANRLHFHMVAHVPNDGTLRSGLNSVGLGAVPSDIAFQVVGTTSVPIFVPDLSGIAKSATKNAAKQVLADHAKKTLAASQKSILANQKSYAPAANARQNRGGFFHNLFGHKDKQNAKAQTQPAVKRVKF